MKKSLGGPTRLVLGAALVLGVLGGLVPLGVASAQAANPWTAYQGPTIPALSPPPQVSLASVSCPSAGNCTAVGSYMGLGSTSALIETETAGTWSAVQEPSLSNLNPPPGTPGFSTLSSVSCPSVGNCTAVGYYSNGNDQPLIETESSGTWRAVQEPLISYTSNGQQINVITPPAYNEPHGTLLSSVSCTATSCTAVGTYRIATNSDDVLIETESSGSWSPVQEPSLSALSPASNSTPVDSLSGVSCTAATTCSAVGSYADASNNDDVLVETDSAGTWSAATGPSLSPLSPAPAATAAATVPSISCTAATSCTAVGSYTDTNSDTDVLIETKAAGAWSAANGPSLSSLSPTSNSAPLDSLSGVSCAAATSCSAIGSYKDTSGDTDVLIETESAGAWSAANGPSLSSLTPAPAAATDDISSGVSCPAATSCSAVGSYSVTSGGFDPLIETEAAGTWSAHQAPSISSLIPAPNVGVVQGADLEGVSCIDASDCTAVGSYDETNGDTDALIETESAGAWSAANGPSLTSLVPGPDLSADVDLDSVSCTALTTCTAVGTYKDENGNVDPLMETESAGTWSAVQAPSLSSLSPAEASYLGAAGILYSVSCTAATTCVAVGSYPGDVDGMSWNQVLVETEAAGTWNASNGASLAPVGIDSQSRQLPSGLEGVSCTAAGSCSAVGSYQDAENQSSEPLIETESAGTWSASPGPALSGLTPPAAGIDAVNALDTISCTDASDCTAVGSYTDTSGPNDVLIETESAGTWGVVQEPSPFVAFIDSVSCASATDCTSVGEDYPTMPTLIETESGGTWNTGTGGASLPPELDAVQLNAVSCPTAGNCTAVGASALIESSVAPTVTGLSPNSGPAAGGTSVTITGTDFATGAGATTVDFGASAATGVSCSSSTTCSATSPAGTGTVDVTVSAGGQSSGPPAADQFTYVSPTSPTVTGLSTNSGPAGGGTTTTITGTGFSTSAGATAVAFGANPATEVSCSSTTSCTATSPPGSGTVDVTVTVAGLTSATSTADQFTYGPAVTGISPNSGPTAGGITVALSGTGFSTSAGATTVAFGANPATGVSCTSTTSCTATNPAGSGTVDVTVSVGGQTSATSTADQFTYATTAISAITPSAGPAGGGTAVSITGTGFSTSAGATTVAFGPNAASAVSCSSTTSCVATSPAGTGTVDVTVTVSGQTSASSSADQFSYASATSPSVTGISPTSGDEGGGTSVDITGTNFSTSATTVDFGTNAATGVSCSSTTSCSATSPAGSGTVDVTVSVGGQTSATVPADEFVYTQSAGDAPDATTVTPPAGPTSGGTTVTVKGSRLEGCSPCEGPERNAAVNGDATNSPLSGTTVTLGPYPCVVTAVTSTQLTCTAGAGAPGTYNIFVTTNDGGTGAPNSSVTYTYAAPPTTSAVTPSSGATTGGTAVTITGTNFVAGATAHLGPYACGSVHVVSSTELTCTSAKGAAGSFYVTVTTPGGTSVNNKAATFTYATGHFGAGVEEHAMMRSRTRASSTRADHSLEHHSSGPSRS